MKRFLSVCLLMLCLCLPVIGGHTQQGGYGKLCECTPINGVCPCCGGSLTVANEQENDSINQNASDGTEPTFELGVIRMTFLIWLKMRA